MLGLVLLVAAPADSVSVEVVDAHAACLADDAELSVIELDAPGPALEPACGGCDRTDIVAPAPVLAGVFRPPRRAAG